MDRSAAKMIPPEELTFHDGLGDRVLVRDGQGRPMHETFLLRAELTAIPSFEFTLNQRMTMLDKFEHVAFVPVRQMLRLPGPVPRVSLVSDYVQATRLSDVLAKCELGNKLLTTGTALFLIKEILDAVAALHRENNEVSHGALAPERILLADGKVLITEYVLGSAIEQLRYTSERYWKDLRVAIPPAAGGVRFDRRVDVAQIGMVAVALLASRPLRDAENMSGLGDVLMRLTQSVGGDSKPLALPLRGWLTKALHMDARRTFATAVEAERALAEAMNEAGIQATPSEHDIVGMHPRRLAPIATVKPQLTTKGVTIAAPSRPPQKQTMAPLRQSTDAWETPSQDTRVHVHPVGTFESMPAPRRFRLSTRAMGFVKLGALGVLMALAFTAAQYIPPPAKLFSSTGTLVIETKPDAIEVFVDGQRQGSTPLTMNLKAGRHEVELRGWGKPRIFNVYVTKGDRVSQYVELPVARLKK